MSVATLERRPFLVDVVCSQADLEHSIEVNSQLRQQLDSSSAGHAMLDAELAGARLAVSAQQKKYEVAQSDRQALAHKVTELAHCEVDLSIAQSELTQLRSEAESLRHAAAEKGSIGRRLAQKEAEVTQLHAELQSMRLELVESGSLTRQLSQKEAERLSLQNDLTQLGAELTVMRSDSQRVRSGHTQQTAELAQIRSDLTRTQAEVAQLRSELTRSQCVVAQKDSELSQLQPELESLRQQAQTWTNQSNTQSLLSQKEAELRQLLTKVSTLQSQLDSAHQQLHTAVASGATASTSVQSEPPSPAVDASTGTSGPQESATIANDKDKALAAQTSGTHDLTQPRLEAEASWHSEAGRPASAPLVEIVSTSLAASSGRDTETMSEGELKKMAEAFRKSLGLEVCTAATAALTICHVFWLMFC